MIVKFKKITNDCLQRTVAKRKREKAHSDQAARPRPAHYEFKDASSRVCSFFGWSGTEWNHSIPLNWNVTVPFRSRVRLENLKWNGMASQIWISNLISTHLELAINLARLDNSN